MENSIVTLDYKELLSVTNEQPFALKRATALINKSLGTTDPYVLTCDKRLPRVYHKENGETGSIQRGFIAVCGAMVWVVQIRDIVSTQQMVHPVGLGANSERAVKNLVANLKTPLAGFSKKLGPNVESASLHQAIYRGLSIYQIGPEIRLVNIPQNHKPILGVGL